MVRERPQEVVGPTLTEFTAGALGLDLGHRVRIEYGDAVLVSEPVRVVALPFTVVAEPGHGLFPVFTGELEVIATADCGIEVTLDGRYDVPAGMLGALVDRMATHTVIEDGIARFFGQLVERLRRGSSSLDALTGVPV
jgi:hypothetical protein